MATARDQVLAWIRRETARRRLEEDGMRPVELPPPEAFSDEYTPVEALLRLRPHADPDETGPESRAVRIVIGRRCCGWRTRPTTREVYDALRAENPTARQLAVMTVVLNAATFSEMVLAHLEGAFTWRQLARAMHLHRCSPPRRARQLAFFARRGEP